jgi:hypothetical protein
MEMAYDANWPEETRKFVEGLEHTIAKAIVQVPCLDMTPVEARYLAHVLDRNIGYRQLDNEPPLTQDQLAQLAEDAYTDVLRPNRKAAS